MRTLNLPAGHVSKNDYDNVTVVMVVMNDGIRKMGGADMAMVMDDGGNGVVMMTQLGCLDVYNDNNDSVVMMMMHCVGGWDGRVGVVYALQMRGIATVSKCPAPRTTPSLAWCRAQGSAYSFGSTTEGSWHHT